MLFFDTEFVLYLNIGGSVCVCVGGWVGGHGKRNMQWINMVGIFIISDTPYHECNTIFSREIHAGFHVFVITGYHKDTSNGIGNILGIIYEYYYEAVTLL